MYTRRDRDGPCYTFTVLAVECTVELTRARPSYSRTSIPARYSYPMICARKLTDVSLLEVCVSLPPSAPSSVSLAPAIVFLSSFVFPYLLPYLLSLLKNPFTKGARFIPPRPSSVMYFRRTIPVPILDTDHFVTLLNFSPSLKSSLCVRSRSSLLFFFLSSFYSEY